MSARRQPQRARLSRSSSHQEVRRVMLDTLKRMPVLARLRADFQHDVDLTLKPLRKEVRRLARDVEQLEIALRGTAERAARGDRQAAQIKWTMALNAAQQDAVGGLDAVL